MVTKKHIAESIVKYITNDLLPEIEDKHLRLVLTIAKHSMSENCNIINEFMNNPIISSIVKEVDGEYDIDMLITILKKTVDELGYYPIVIPKIPLLSSDEKILRFTSSDIERIVNYLSMPEENKTTL